MGWGTRATGDDFGFNEGDWVCIPGPYVESSPPWEADEVFGAAFPEPVHHQAALKLLLRKTPTFPKLPSAWRACKSGFMGNML